MIMRKIIEEKLHDIYQELLHYNEDDFRLMGVTGGKLLYYAYYSKYTNCKETETTFNKYVDLCLKNLNQYIVNPTFCNGLAGMLSCFTLLKEEKLLNIDLTEASQYCDPYLSNVMLKYISTRNYDYLHGASGIAYYLLQHPTLENNDALCQFVSGLEAASFRDGLDIYWKTNFLIEKPWYLDANISLAHGMASIVIILLHLHKKKISQEKIEYLIKGAIHFILSQKLDTQSSDSCYPSYNKKIDNFSRLGWCYGDLGVALALWQTGKYFNNPAWYNEAIDIFRIDSQRRESQKNHVNDSCFCHGASGVAHIYKYMFDQTGHQDFRDTDNFWLSQTIAMAEHEGGPAKYKYLSDKGFRIDYTLLNGLTGTGLALLAAERPSEYSEWHRLLLMDNF